MIQFVIMGENPIVNKINNKQTLENLVIAYKKCSDEKKKKVLHLRIIEQTLELVKKIATPIAVQTGTPTEDLIQVGALGLIVKFRNSYLKLIRQENHLWMPAIMTLATK